MARLEEIEARCAAATAGPWQEDTCSVICRCGWSELAGRHVDGGYYGVICEAGTYDDCQSLPFIAAAREDVPWLIAEVKRLQAENEALAKFKAYVHQRLDDAGVPADPFSSPHNAKGCRIGDRLDLVLASIAEVKRLRAALARTRVALAPFADGNSPNLWHKEAYDVLQEQP